MEIVLCAFCFGSFYAVLVRFICTVTHCAPFPPVSCRISMEHTCFSVLCPAVFPWDTHIMFTPCEHLIQFMPFGAHTSVSLGVYVGLEFLGPLVLGCHQLQQTVSSTFLGPISFYVGEFFIARCCTGCQAPTCCCLLFSSSVCVFSLSSPGSQGN